MLARRPALALASLLLLPPLGLPGPDDGPSLRERLEAIRAAREGRSPVPKAAERSEETAVAAGKAAAAATRKEAEKKSMGALTPRERQLAHNRVLDMMRAVEGGDVTGFARGLARDFALNRSILENAIRDEAREQTDIRIEIFAEQVQAKGDTLRFRFAWNRQANDVRQGSSDGTEGTATFLMDRTDELKVTQMQGPLPFGIRDREVVRQAGGGPARRMDTRQPVKLQGF